MKKAVHLFFAVLALTGITAKAWSQNTGYTSEGTYKNGVGIRIGSENGFTFKHFYKPDWAFEGMLTTGYRALVATALLEKHLDVRNTEGLSVFFGGGAHIGHWSKVGTYNYRYYDGETFRYKSYENKPSGGVDGIFGVEYKIRDIPFSVGADVKPYVDFFRPDDSWIEGAFSLRYLFH